MTSTSEMRRRSSSEEKSKVERGGAEEESARKDDLDHVAPQLSRGAVFAQISKGAVGAEDKGANPPRCSPNVQALAVSAFLFSLITALQVVAAKIARSQALMMDCISMAVDALTYMGNIVVECRKRDGGDHARSQLVVVACSLGCLIYFTIDAGMESLETARECQSGTVPEGDDVNGYITLAFAVGGLLFDVACIVAFHRSNKKTGDVRQVNMFSALLHVGADFLRSGSTCVMSLLILLAGVNSTCLDAYTSLFIGGTIVLGAMKGLFEWLKLLLKVCGSS